MALSKEAIRAIAIRGSIKRRAAAKAEQAPAPKAKAKSKKG